MYPVICVVVGVQFCSGVLHLLFNKGPVSRTTGSQMDSCLRAIGFSPLLCHEDFISANHIPSPMWVWYGEVIHDNTHQSCYFGQNAGL